MSGASTWWQGQLEALSRPVPNAPAPKSTKPIPASRRAYGPDERIALLQAKRRLGLTQKQIASAIGVSETKVGDWLQGTVRSMPERDARALEALLGVEL